MKKECIFLLFIAAAMWMTCTEDNGDIIPGINGHIAGLVTTPDDQPLAGIRVSAGNATSLSDGTGNFLLEQVEVNNAMVVTFAQGGYVTNHKVVAVKEDQYSYVEVSMSLVDKIVNVDASAANEVAFNGARIVLPAGGIVDANGTPVTGNITVEATYFNPTMEGYANVFPGDFTGTAANGSTGLLESYGFINVVLSQGNTPLDLAEGQVSDITIPIPAAFLSGAPDPIPLFYFDEVTGTWREEGSASIVDGAYKGQVSHFSNWNCDFMYIDEICTLKGRVVDQNGTPLNNALVRADGIDFAGGNSSRSGTDGRFSMRIKSDAHVSVFARVFSPTTQIVYGRSARKDVNPTCSPGGMNDVGDLVIVLDTTSHTNGNTESVWWDIAYSVDDNGDPGFWVVGRNGRILYSNSADSTSQSFIWEEQSSNTSQTLLGVHFVDNNRGWVCGNNGTVLKTTNGGNSWESISLNTFGNDLYEVEFYGDQHGWMVGSAGSIWYTDDGGISWTESNESILQNLYDVDFVSEDIGWSVGTVGKIFKTMNGGRDWSEQNSGTTKDLYGVSFVNELFGYAVGLDGTLLKTNNGGQNWNSITSPTGEDLLSVTFITDDYGVIVGSNGRVISTEDGGNTWDSKSLGSMELWDVEIFLGILGMAVGEEAIETLSLPFQSNTDGWPLIAKPVNTYLSRLIFSDDQTAWVIGDQGLIMRSDDQGSSWSVLGSVVTENLNDIDFIGNNGIICGDNRSFLRSADGGQNWGSVSQTAGGANYLRAQFNDALRGWVLSTGEDGSNGSLLYTLDGGNTFFAANGLPAEDDIYYTDFYFLDTHTGYLVGYMDESPEKGLVYRSTDGGINWVSIDPLPFDEGLFLDVYFMDADFGWITGDMYSNAHLYTTDGGQNWHMKYDYFNFGAFENQFMDRYNGWSITGAFLNKDSGTLRHTVDGGTEWYKQGLPEDITGFHMISKLIGIAIAADGSIYKTTTGGF